MPEYSDTIFTKTYDLLTWLMPITEGFPKSQRFVLAKRLQDTTLDFYELIVRARRSPDRAAVLFEADLKLEQLRLYTRLCADPKMKLLNPNQYEHGARLIDEIGRLLGSWIKRVKGTPPK